LVLKKGGDKMKLLEDYKEGWHFRVKNRETGIWRSSPKFHYFKNSVSLCGKYENDAGNYLSGSALSQKDCCKECLKILKILKGGRNENKIYRG